MKVVINEKTPTTNSMYLTNQWGKRYVKTTTTDLKDEIVRQIDIQLKELSYWRDDWVDKLLKVRIEIHEDWWTKKNTVKKKDIANKEKFVIDTVFAALGIDDSFIWEITLVKFEDENEFTEVFIEQYSAMV